MECYIHWQEVLGGLEGKAHQEHEKRSNGSGALGILLEVCPKLRGLDRGCRFQTWHAQKQHWVPDLCAGYPCRPILTFPSWAALVIQPGESCNRVSLQLRVIVGLWVCVEEELVNNWLNGYDSIGPEWQLTGKRVPVLVLCHFLDAIPKSLSEMLWIPALFVYIVFNEDWNCSQKFGQAVS